MWLSVKQILFKKVIECFYITIKNIRFLWLYTIIYMIMIIYYINIRAEEIVSNEYEQINK